MIKVCVLFDDVCLAIRVVCSETITNMESVSYPVYILLKDLDTFCVPEPRVKLGNNRRSPTELLEPWWHQRSHVDFMIEAGLKPSKVAVGEGHHVLLCRGFVYSLRKGDRLHGL